VTWVWVAVAGALGALTRYGVGVAIGPQVFPWGTWAVNISGSFLLGLVLTLGTRLPDHVTTAIAVGYIGAFTTYSTFSWELFTLGRTDRLLVASAYLASSVVLGILAAALGYRLGRLLQS